MSGFLPYVTEAVQIFKVASHTNRSLRVEKVRFCQRYLLKMAQCSAPLWSYIPQGGHKTSWQNACQINKNTNADAPPMLWLTYWLHQHIVFHSLLLFTTVYRIQYVDRLESLVGCTQIDWARLQICHCWQGQGSGSINRMKHTLSMLPVTKCQQLKLPLWAWHRVTMSLPRTAWEPYRVLPHAF